MRRVEGYWRCMHVSPVRKSSVCDHHVDRGARRLRWRNRDRYAAATYSDHGTAHGDADTASADRDTDGAPTNRDANDCATDRDTDNRSCDRNGDTRRRLPAYG